MGIPHSHVDGLVSEEFLHLVKVYPVLNKPGRKGMSQVMNPGILDFCFGEGLFKCLSEAPVRDWEYPA